ncbi:MAG: hypothetical protein ACPHJ3_04095, partial [Rubripirellula sp.]
MSPSGSIHLVNEKTMLIGREIASKSVIVIFAGNTESDSWVGRNGLNMSQPITPDIAKYGNAKISNIS